MKRRGSAHGFPDSAAAADSLHKLRRGAKLSKAISDGSACTPLALRFLAERSLLARPWQVDLRDAVSAPQAHFHRRRFDVLHPFMALEKKLCV